MESPWIGPRNIEHSRDIIELWERLISTEGYSDAYAILNEAINVFREALNCYQNGAYLATCLLCRTVIESAVYLALTRNIEGKKRIEVNLNYINAKWGRIEKEARRKGLLGSKEITIINKIRELGNIGAHYAQKVDEILIKNISERENRKGVIKIWPDREDALKKLKNTVLILQIIIRKVHKKLT
mgnify:CR=1 FL=1